MFFNVSTVNLINMLFISGGIAVCGMCFMQVAGAAHLRKEIKLYFKLFFGIITLYIACHLARQLMDGIAGGGIRIALHTVTFIEMAAAGYMAHLMSLLVASVARPNKDIRKFGYCMLGLFIVHVIILAVSLPFNFIYSFDENNVYSRSAGYLISNLAPAIMLVIDTVKLIKYRKNIDKLLKSALWIYIIAPVVAMALQGIFYGLQLIIFATVGAAIYMFSVIVQRQTIAYEKQKMENSRIESELTLASSIQETMLPTTSFPDRKDFEIFASMTPAREVGGDFYDYFLIDDDHLGLVMADVSGKGVPAALFMMASRIIIAGVAKSGKSPAEILSHTNEAICQNNKQEMFVTVWVGILELSTGKLTAANAGHEYPVIMQPDGNFEIFKDKHGLVIGGMSGVKYQQYEVTLQKGAKLFLYTDGVPEATSGEKVLFGMERMLNSLNAHKGDIPCEILKNVRVDIDKFVNGAEQFDDITMLCVEYKGE